MEDIRQGVLVLEERPGAVQLLEQIASIVQARRNVG
jgi:hypothetical protein